MPTDIRRPSRVIKIRTRVWNSIPYIMAFAVCVLLVVLTTGKTPSDGVPQATRDQPLQRPD